MQSKGKLGSIVAGVIAIFLALICLFYLSFSWKSSQHETAAEVYANNIVNAQVGGAGNDSIYNQAYKHYMDSLGDQKVWMGYTLNEARQWGVGLGLDLKGGMNVILQVDMPEMLTSLRNSEAPDSTFNQALRAASQMVNSHQTDDYIGSFVAEYQKLNNNTANFAAVFNNVDIPSNASNDAVVSILRNEVNDMVNNSATNVLRSRIDQFGVVSPNIQVLQGKDGQILMELPGVKDHERVRDLLQRSAVLEFYEVYDASEILPRLSQLQNRLSQDTVYTNSVYPYLDSQRAGGAIVGFAVDQKAMDEVNAAVATPIAQQVLPADLKLRWSNKPEVLGVDANGKNVEAYALYALKTRNGKPALDGSAVSDASAEYDNQNMRDPNYVSMRMNSEGAREWARVTSANLKKPIAILLDNRVYSAPVVQSVIEGGSSSITGRFSLDEAKDLANVLKSGKMNATVHIISDMVIGPSLGRQAIEKGFTSFIVALVLLMIFMMLFYGVIPGLVANLGLLLNLFFTLGILASFQAVLTMSGIAGIVLSLGMAVDANVLIFERAKEELRAGKNARQAIADGYSNAFSAIFDSNLTSVITGVILMIFGTGPIKGFATTLIIGIVCSFFTAVYLTRWVFIWGAKKKAFEELTFSTSLSKKLWVNTNFNFLDKRKISFTIVAIMVVVVACSFWIRGLNQGIDFSGGRNYVVKFEQPVNAAELQEVLQKQFENSSVSVITIESSNQVRVSTNYKINDEDENTEKEITGRLFEALKPYLRADMTPQEFSTTDASQGIVSSQKVGPTVADDMRDAAYIAVTLALIAMFLYILLRFRNVAFSLGALAAVCFTAFSIIGFYSLFWGFLPFAMEVDQTFIAAILTVIGYQINDTVVVFDRVRENVGLYPKQDFGVTINKSLNQTLSRTIMTSCSTLLVLLCIFILGGDAIRSFTFAMIFGVIIGTFASIFIAAPVAYITDSRRKAAAAKKA